MEHNFEYRQHMRQERLRARQRAALQRRIRLLTTLCSVLFLAITVISANAVIANAGQGYEKEYQKLYTSIEVESGDTVWSIAGEHMTPGYESVEALMEEIAYINSLDDAYSIQCGRFLMIPYYVEV